MIIENLNKILGYPDDYFDNFCNDVLNDKENSDIKADPESGDNVEQNMSEKEANESEGIEETVTIVQEVKAADKIKVLAEIELDDSDSENMETGINTKTSKLGNKSSTAYSNPNIKTRESAALIPFKCVDCFDSFSDKQDFRRHMANKHQKTFECHYCNIFFTFTDDDARCQKLAYYLT